MTVELHLAQDAEADRLLSDNPLALVIGMVLDQQIPLEKAFSSPAELVRRIGGPLDAATIARMDPGELGALFKERPALHRFPGSMAKRTHALCQHLVDEYGGDAGAVWRGVTSGDELYARLVALPGFGAEKAKIFQALLAKRLEVRPDGWERAAAPFSDDTPRSVADIDSPETLARVRDWKRTQKRHGWGKAD